MALMARSKHKTNKGKNSRPHPKNPKRQHTTTTLQARGGVRQKAARKAERSTGVSAMQTDESRPAANKTGFKVGSKGKLKKGKKKPARSVNSKGAAPSVASSMDRGGDDGDDFEGMLPEDDLAGDSDGIPADLLDDNTPSTDANLPQTTNQKKKAKQKQRSKKKSAVEFEASRSVAAAISEAEPSQQAAWLWQSFCAHSGTDPAQGSGFDSSSIVQMGSGKSLEQQLKVLAGDAWQQELTSEQGRLAGSPSVLLMSASAAAANDLIKLMPGFNQSCKVAKLFAKHIKLIEQQTLLTKRAPAIAVGTPHRVHQLADLQALKLGKLGLVLIDVTLDAKQQTILDIPETSKDFWALFQAHLGPMVAAGRTRIGLFVSETYRAS